MKIQDPERAKEFEEYMFQRNEIDEGVHADVDLSEVKLYPGSEKGPLPEDDIEHYSQWFVENQPKGIYKGQPTDYADIGAKRKFVRMVRDESEMNE